MSDLKARIHRDGIRFVECAASDFSSTARGKLPSAEDFLVNGGCRMASVVLGLTVTAETPADLLGHFLPSSYDDVDLRADLDTLRPQPGRPHVLSVICEPHGALRAEVSGRCFDANDLSPRAALRRTLDRLHAAGIAARVAPELELFLVRRCSGPDGEHVEPAGARPGSPAREVGCEADSVERAGYFAAYFDDLYNACHEMGIPMTGYAHESAHGQYEVNFKPGEPLAQADAVFRFKRLARSLAERHGFLATFIAKPYLNQPGTGMHWHFSLRFLADDSNVFLALPEQPQIGPALSPVAASAHEPATSPRLERFVAGLQHHAPAMMAFLAPYEHSYDRIRRADASPSRANWGVDDRMTAFRVPRSSAANRRIENRLPGGDSNPYLTVALSLGLGLYGMQEGLSTMTEPHVLPGSLTEALDALRQDTVVRAIVGEPLADLYDLVKRREIQDRQACANPRAQWDIPYLLEQA